MKMEKIVFMDNFEKLCYDKGELEEYKYLLMLDMTLEELASFYPSDEIIREYGDALMKYSEDTFIYPYSEEEEKEMLHNTELDLAYNEGVEQNKIEIIKNLKDKLSIQEIAEVAKLSIERVKEILNDNK